MAGRLEGKVAIVTGAGSGMGQSTAERLHQEGAKVVLVDISGEHEKIAAALGEGALAVTADVTKSADMQEAVAVAEREFGGLDVIHNNAGIGGPLVPIEDLKEEDWDHVLAVDLKSVYLGIKFAIPAMRKRGGGSIINTASLAAKVVFPNQPSYCAAKGGVVMLTKFIAAEYGPDKIRANAILPGAINTPLTRSFPADQIQQIANVTPIRRLGEPEEIANLVTFLASDESMYVTGTAIEVDGGYSLY